MDRKSCRDRNSWDLRFGHFRGGKREELSNLDISIMDHSLGGSIGLLTSDSVRLSNTPTPSNTPSNTPQATADPNADRGPPSDGVASR